MLTGKAFLSQVVTDFNQPILSQKLLENYSFDPPTQLQLKPRRLCAVNVRFQNPASPQSLRPLRFQKRAFTAPIIMEFYTFS